MADDLEARLLAGAGREDDAVDLLLDGAGSRPLARLRHRRPGCSSATCSPTPTASTTCCRSASRWWGTRSSSRTPWSSRSGQRFHGLALVGRRPPGRGPRAARRRAAGDRRAHPGPARPAPLGARPGAHDARRDRPRRGRRTPLPPRRSRPQDGCTRHRTPSSRPATARGTPRTSRPPRRTTTPRSGSPTGSTTPPSSPRPAGCAPSCASRPAASGDLAELDAVPGDVRSRMAVVGGRGDARRLLAVRPGRPGAARRREPPRLRRKPRGGGDPDAVGRRRLAGRGGGLADACRARAVPRGAPGASRTPSRSSARRSTTSTASGGTSAAHQVLQRWVSLLDEAGRTRGRRPDPRGDARTSRLSGAQPSQPAGRSFFGILETTRR